MRRVYRVGVARSVWLFLLTATIVSLSGASPAQAVRGGKVAGTLNKDWPQYLYGPDHTSYNAADTGITPANASSLQPIWNWLPAKPTMPGQPPANVSASPVVANGMIYIGAVTGVFYALNEQTGAVVWQRFLGFTPPLTCTEQGIISTAAVVRQSDLAVGPVWTMQVSLSDDVDPHPPGQCDAAAAWDGTSLYIGGNTTTINGVTVNGSIQRVDTSTGDRIWEDPLPGEVIGSPTLNGSGLLAVPTMGTSAQVGNVVDLININDGTIVKSITLTGKDFPQPVFANGNLFVAGGNTAGLTEWRPSPTG